MDIRNKGFYLGLASITLVSTSTISHAVSISNDQRQVRINGEVSSYNLNKTWSEQAFADSSQVDFNQALIHSGQLNSNTVTSSASIASSIIATENQTVFSGSGNAYSSVSYTQENNPRFRRQYANSFSNFEITFSLTEAANFDLIGSLFYDEPAGNPYGGAVFSLTSNYYSNPGFSLTLGNQNSYNDFSQAIQLSGLLDPGSYRLKAYASTNANLYGYNTSTLEANASYNFNFTLNQGLSNSPPQVPIPAAAWLFGSALLGLFGLRTKKANR